MPKFGMLKMNLGSEPIHEKALEQNKITAEHSDFYKLVKGDIVLVLKGSDIPFALVEVIEEISNDERIEPTFPNGKDFKVKVLGYAKTDKGSNDFFLSGTYINVPNTTTNRYKYISNWYNSIKQQNKNNMYIDILKANKNLILTGAPGTGKSYLAKKISEQIMSSKKDIAQKLFDEIRIEEKIQQINGKSFIAIKKNENGIITYEKENNRDAVVKFDSVWNKIETNNFSPKNGDDSYSMPIAKYIVNDERYRIDIKKQDCICFVQFHPSYDYTDFVEGLRPIKKEETLGFELKNGIFKDFCKKAKNDPNNNYVFIIDEINRAEISKVFGELFFSIDPSYRGEKGKVKTQYTNIQTDKTCFIDKDDDYFYIPENVYIIGTMNDIDRSVESFDFAMRRRFTWVEITAKQSAENMNLPDEIKNKMEKLNDVIYKDKNSKIEGLNTSFHIGGAYFLDKEGKPRTDYNNIWKYRIEPLLSEYLRGMPDAEENLIALKEAYGK